MDTAARANALLSKAREQTASDMKKVFAEHGAKGLLRSGATIKATVRIYSDRSSEALDQVLNEVSKRINHRGSQWKTAMEAIRLSLDSHVAVAPTLIEPALRIAGPESGASRRAADLLMDEVATSLRDKINDFDDGWTSPTPMKWQERNPVIYATLLLFSGAAINELIKFVFEIVG